MKRESGRGHAMRWVVSGIVLVLLCLAFSTTTSFADTQKSAHYQFEEQSLGGNSLLNMQSSNYQATGTSGILGLNSSTSTSFQVQAGHQTTNDPALAFSVTTSNVSFGAFSATAATVTTSTFQVLDYTSYGYVVQIVGTPPTNGGHTITAMATNGASQAGVEQFGINLVANTSPVSVGANPVFGQFGSGGAAATNYNTANSYRYVSGETIATGSKSSGLTTYTITYLVNVGDLTPAGQYVSSQSIVCTGTY